MGNYAQIPSAKKRLLLAQERVKTFKNPQVPEGATASRPEPGQSETEKKKKRPNPLSTIVTETNPTRSSGKSLGA